MAKEVSPGVKALRKVVEDVYADARVAKKEGKLCLLYTSKAFVNVIRTERVHGKFYRRPRD